MGGTTVPAGGGYPPAGTRSLPGKDMGPEVGNGPGTRDWGTTPERDMGPEVGNGPGTRYWVPSRGQTHTPVKTLPSSILQMRLVDITIIRYDTCLIMYLFLVRNDLRYLIVKESLDQGSHFIQISF